ncbi:hypothetical protein ACK30V_18385, partial [Aeromonas caviae]
KDAVPAGRKMVIGMMLLADRHDVISQEPRSGLILFSSRYMAGRVSRAPGADEAPLLEGLEAIKAQSRALD